MSLNLVVFSPIKIGKCKETGEICQSYKQCCHKKCRDSITKKFQKCCTPNYETCKSDQDCCSRFCDHGECIKYEGIFKSSLKYFYDIIMFQAFIYHVFKFFILKLNWEKMTWTKMFVKGKFYLGLLMLADSALKKTRLRL